ncbi:MAG: DUF3347 domain-containing protein [Flavobacterium micromati]|nr:DUF3347 domain-containing protein [Flavobacterium micromati]
MKNIISSAISLAFVLTSCNQKSKEEETINSQTIETESPFVSPTPQDTTNDVTKTKPETTVPTANQSSFSTNEIVSDYLKLKNALVKDDSKAAANAGKKLLVTLKNTNANSLDAKSKKEYVDIADNAKKHTEHIGDNAGKIDHQREHFALLSKDINDLIKTFGTTQKLYQDYCPMYDEGKSGYWISEIKEIKNPYYGSQMLTCGGIKKTY